MKSPVAQDTYNWQITVRCLTHIFKTVCIWILWRQLNFGRNWKYHRKMEPFGKKNRHHLFNNWQVFLLWGRVEQREKERESLKQAPHTTWSPALGSVLWPWYHDPSWSPDWATQEPQGQVVLTWLFSKIGELNSNLTAKALIFFFTSKVTFVYHDSSSDTKGLLFIF